MSAFVTAKLIEGYRSVLEDRAEEMEAGKSIPQIAAELGLTYRQVKHAACYVQHPEVPMPTR